MHAIFNLNCVHDDERRSSIRIQHTHSDPVCRFAKIVMTCSWRDDDDDMRKRVPRLRRGVGKEYLPYVKPKTHSNTATRENDDKNDDNVGVFVDSSKTRTESFMIWSLCEIFCCYCSSSSRAALAAWLLSTPLETQTQRKPQHSTSTAQTTPQRYICASFSIRARRKAICDKIEARATEIQTHT